MLIQISRPDSLVFLTVTGTEHGHGHDFDVERTPEELKGEGKKISERSNKCKNSTTYPKLNE
jgi:hypothetical protein